MITLHSRLPFAEHIQSHFISCLPLTSSCEDHYKGIHYWHISEQCRMCKGGSLTWLCRYNFIAREEEAAELEMMTLKDVQETYEIFLKPSSQAARRLCIHVVGKEHAQELDSAEPSLGKLMPEISEFRALEHYPPILGELPLVGQD